MKLSYEYKLMAVYSIIFFSLIFFNKGYYENLWDFVKKVQLHRSHIDWQDLTQSQQETLQALKQDWNNLTEDKKIIFYVLSKRILQLDKRNITIFKDRIQKWSLLSPEERREVRDSYLASLEISQNVRIKAWNAYQELTPDEKQLLERQAFKKKSLVNSPSLPK
jgi:Protein of unknown function (DUF3106)